MPIFNFTGGLQSFTIPANVCEVRIRAVGARGGNVLNFTGGLGVEVMGTFPVTPGETLTVLVGGAGIDSNVGNSAGGGGGSFVWRGNGVLNLAANPMENLLIAAGAGGGAAAIPISVNNGNNGGDGQTGTIGESGQNAPNDGGSGGGGGNNVTGGFAGSGNGGGTAGSPGGNGFGAGGGGGGASFFDGGGGGGGGISGTGGSGGNNSNGNVHGGAGGFSIIVGGAGGIGGIGTTINGTNGGFGGGGGGGGGGESPPAGGGGGGGGFAGGGGGGAFGNFPPPAGGGGGSSFIHPSGINTTATSGVGTGNGIVEITLLNDPPCPVDEVDDLVNTECIRVPKVYDWTLSQTQEQREITPPVDCVQPIADAIASGQLVTVTCTAPPIDLRTRIVSIPVPSFCSSDEVRCLEIGREDVTLVDGTQAQLVAMVSSIPLHLVVSANGIVICEFDTHVKIFQKEVLCAPQGTRVLCQITQIICDAVLLNECQIVVNVSICKEIQVEAEVKLEVIADFCRPRAPIPPNTLPLSCPPVGQFPEQCPSIFPTPACDCSVTGVASGEFYVPILFDLLGLSILSTTLTITICPNCQTTGSSIVGSLTVLEVLGINVITIPLEATSINPPVCNFPNPGVTTITGLLTLSVDGLIGLSLPFTLIIDTNTNVVTLTINILGIPLTLTPLSAAGLTIIDCND